MRNRRNELAIGVAASGLACAVALSAHAGPKNTYVDPPKFTDAATSPLRDIGMMHRKVDPSLQQARAAPYSMEQVKECSAAKAEIGELDAVLGPDIDAGATNTRTKRQMVKAFAADAVSSAVKIPFRSVIRIVSGADRRDRERQDAIMAGMARRAFLKGVVVGRCQGDDVPYLQVAAAPPAPPKVETPPVRIARAEPPPAPRAEIQVAVNAPPPVQPQPRYVWRDSSQPAPHRGPPVYAQSTDPYWVGQRAAYSSNQRDRPVIQPADDEEDDGYGQVRNYPPLHGYQPDGR
jgi:hypothetical protein